MTETEREVDVFAAAGTYARERARVTVANLVQDVVGDDGLREVPIWPGARTTERRPEPRAGLQAALRLKAEAMSQVRRYVEELRGAGVGWLEIAAEVRRDPQVEHEQAGEVFEEFAVGDEFRPAWVSWRCDTCGERVLDYGPYNPHPDDVEHGHGQDCARHAADIVAFEMERTGGNG